MNLFNFLKISTEVMGDVTYAQFESRESVLDALVDNKVPIGLQFF